MAYRKGYYKKDGTYVQGHYSSHRPKADRSNNNAGCLAIFITLTSIILKVKLY